MKEYIADVRVCIIYASKGEIAMIDDSKTKDQDSGIAVKEPLSGPVKEFGVLPVRGMVLYPSIMSTLTVGRERSVRLVNEVIANDRTIVIVTQKDQDVAEPAPDDLYDVGVIAEIVRMLRMPDNNIHILVNSKGKVRLKEFTQTDPYLKASVEKLYDIPDDSPEAKALARNISLQFQRIVSIVPHLQDELQISVINLEDEPSKMADFVAFWMVNMDVNEKQKILGTLNVKERLSKLTILVSRQLETLEAASEIQSHVQAEMGKLQREHYLREQLKAIQKELGQGNEQEMEIEELRQKIEAAGMSEEAKKEADRELNRLTKMAPAAAEYTVARTYLDWLISLPWSVSTEDNLDIKGVKRVLDEDHYGLEKVKERILEYLSVRKLKPDTKGPILCFVGPPGVGKTSLGRSIARALGRKFIRISLGGVRDEAEIRGHRRTYIGSLPGRIIQSIRKAESNNPIFMLDEIDKMGADFRGDPSAALLEVLDPEQNFSFSDHYLDVPFDLSKVMFITTANLLAPIPPALKDRMEVIELHGYTAQEKVRITLHHLIPRQLNEHGINEEDLKLSKQAILTMIGNYTREAGLRNIEREIGAIYRKIAKRKAEGEKGPFKVGKNDLHKYLGPVRFFSDVAERVSDPRVATGLAWTESGGDILFVEATKMKGNKVLTLTGQLGDVMKESAEAALSYVRSKAVDLGINEDFFEKNDIHIHVPAGAIPKDGPSAGVTIVTALVSLMRGQPVRWNVAMTGEITLRGKVLPIGGVKEKVLAAQRAGITTVVLPKKNEKDLEDVPQNIKGKMTFILAENIDDVLKAAFKIQIFEKEVE